MRPDEQARTWNSLNAEQQAALKAALGDLGKQVKPKFTFLIYGCLALVLIVVVIVVLVPTASDRTNQAVSSPAKRHAAAVMEADLMAQLDHWGQVGLKEREVRSEWLELRWEESAWLAIPYTEKRKFVDNIGAIWDGAKRNTTGQAGHLKVSGYRTGETLATWAPIVGARIK